MAKNRVVRLNSLLKEVISEVLHRDIHHNPLIDESITVTNVEITADLSYAKVLVSIFGDDAKKIKVLDALTAAAPQVGYIAARKVVMRHFPVLHFQIDTGLEKQLRIQELLLKISEERELRSSDDESE